ncbi:MAG: nuclear transport factor 2 family protein [Maribacter sp.]
MKSILTFSLILTIASLSAQMTPEEVVQKQLETYNNLDIDGFMSVIDQNISMHDFASGKITLEGYDACEKVYADLFEASPNLHSKIITRTVFDNKVIDHEHITGRKGSDIPIELVLIYEVNDEKITKISVLRKQE